MNKNKIDNNDINNLTFEEALEELEKITRIFYFRSKATCK